MRLSLKVVAWKMTCRFSCFTIKPLEVKEKVRDYVNVKVKERENEEVGDQDYD